MLEQFIGSGSILRVKLKYGPHEVNCLGTCLLILILKNILTGIIFSKELVVF